MAPIVDIHCHIFNGDDLPVRGFIERVFLHNSDLGRDLVALLDMLVQASAPGFRSELNRLNALLGDDDAAFYGVESAPALASGSEGLEAEVDAALLELQGMNPTLLKRVGTALDDETMPLELVGTEGLGDSWGAARRAVRWIKLYGKYRYELAGLMIENFGEEIDLYIPMLVDLEFGLLDRAKTSPAEQIELLEKISRLSMLGLLPGGGKAQIHPFLGFDPRRQVRAERSGDIESPLDLLERAVTKYGFLGVKLYPPMGWRPINNTPTVEMGQALADAIDDVLVRFYQKCVDLDIPITAHGNDSNHAHRTFGGFGGPAAWEPVLQAFPKLRLNLGHFGGAHVQEEPGSWPRAIARLMESYDVFADVGNHRIYDSDIRDGYLATLSSIFAESEKAQSRIMYGSDWFMVALHPEHDEFLDQYREAITDTFPQSSHPGLVDSFLGGAALRFLGLSEDSLGQNTTRLQERYGRYVPPEKWPAWLPGAVTADPAAVEIPT